jgi:abortive infection bacteriophage resistance protein
MAFTIVTAGFSLDIYLSNIDLSNIYLYYLFDKMHKPVVGDILKGYEPISVDLGYFLIKLYLIGVFTPST